MVDKACFLKRFFGFFWKQSVSSVNAVGGLADKAVDVAGDAVVTVGEFTGKAVGAVGGGIKSVVSSMLNTSKFLANAQYRREVGYPWLRALLRENWQRIRNELGESEDMLRVLWKYSRGKDVSKKEAETAKAQLYDVMRVVPALAIFALPGGAILLPLLARALPWDLMPSSFRKKVEEEFGSDALNSELQPGEEIPMDREVQIPEDISVRAQENIEKALEIESAGIKENEQI